MPYKNKSDYNRWMRDWRKRNRKKYDAIVRRAKAKRPEFYRGHWRSPANNITNSYIRQQLSQNTNIPRGVWPQWLIDLKRASLKLKRKYGIHQNNRHRTQHAD